MLQTRLKQKRGKLQDMAYQFHGSGNRVLDFDESLFKAEDLRASVSHVRLNKPLQQVVSKKSNIMGLLR